jgi:hypothetical protein
MARYDEEIQMALELIKESGQQVIYRQVDKVENPTEPWLPGEGTVHEYNPYICFLPLDKEGREFLSYLGQTEAIVGGYYGLMGQVPFNPDKLRDTIIRDGVVLNINSIDLLSPNGQKVLYTIIFNG